MKAVATVLSNNVLMRAKRENIRVTPMKLQKLLYYFFGKNRLTPKIKRRKARFFLQKRAFNIYACTYPKNSQRSAYPLILLKQIRHLKIIDEDAIIAYTGTKMYSYRRR